MKWHGKLEEFSHRRHGSYINITFLTVCFATVIILLKPVVVYICVCCGRGGLQGLSRLVLFAYYVKRKKLRDFLSVIILKLCGWNETFRTSRGLPPGQILVTC